MKSTNHHYILHAAAMILVLALALACAMGLISQTYAEDGITNYAIAKRMIGDPASALFKTFGDPAGWDFSIDKIDPDLLDAKLYYTGFVAVIHYDQANPEGLISDVY